MYSGALGSDSLGFNVYSTVVAKVGEFQSESPNTTKIEIQRGYKLYTYPVFKW